MKPTALTKKAARADEMIQQAARQRAGVAEPMSPAAEPAQPAAEPAQPDDGSAAARPQDFGRDQTPAASDSEEKPPAAAQKPAQPADDFEQKYRVLQGKYNAELPQAREAARRATEEAQQLRDRMTAMEARLSEAEKVAHARNIAPITDKEREEFGEDLLDAAARSALSRPEIAEIISSNAELRREVAELRKAMAGASAGVARTARERVYDHMDATVKDWREVNKSPEFLGWLEQEDGFSGESRGSLLRRAFEANDAKRVARFFTSFVEETSRARPAPKVDPETLLSPGTGRSAAPAQPNDSKIIWTPDSIRAFYRDLQKGVYTKNPDTAAELERDIFRAQAEGRVSV